MAIVTKEAQPQSAKAPVTQTEETPDEGVSITPQPRPAVSSYRVIQGGATMRQNAKTVVRLKFGQRINAPAESDLVKGLLAARVIEPWEAPIRQRPVTLQEAVRAAGAQPDEVFEAAVVKGALAATPDANQIAEVGDSVE